MKDFTELTDDIASTEKLVHCLGLCLAIALGALDLILVLVYCFMPRNYLVDWSAMMSGESDAFHKAQGSSVVYVNIVAAIKSFLFIIWFFVARIYIK